MELESVKDAAGGRLGCRGSELGSFAGQRQRTVGTTGGAVAALQEVSHGKVVSGSEDGGLGLWDVEAGELVGEVVAHDGAVVDVRVVGGDGPVVLSGGDDGLVRIWDVRSGQHVGKIQAHFGAVSQLAYVDDGIVASAGVDGATWVWSLGSGQRLGGFEVPSGPIWSVLAVGSERVVSGALDGHIRVFDVKTGKVDKLAGHHSSVWQLLDIGAGAFASACADGEVRLWHLDRGCDRETAVLYGHTASVEAMAMLDDKTLATGSFDTTARLWDTTNSTAVGMAMRGHRGFVRCCASFHNCLATSSNDGTIRLWSRRGGALVGVDGGSPVEALTVTGEAIVSGDVTGAVRVWRPGLGNL